MEYPTRRPSEESDQLRLARFLADLLDQRFTIPGTSIRIGLDPIIGLIPGIGDLVANVTGSLILIIAARIGVPRIALVRMGLNVAVNTLLGAVPFFGDILSIWFRSNVRNVELLQRYLGRPTRRAMFGDWLLVAVLLILLLALIGAMVIAGVWVARQVWNTLAG
jgi:hypothetical protein